MVAKDSFEYVREQHNKLSVISTEFRNNDFYLQDLVQRVSALSKHANATIKTDIGKSLLEWINDQLRVLNDMRQGKPVTAETSDKVEPDDNDYVVPDNDVDENPDSDTESEYAEKSFYWWLTFVGSEVWTTVTDILTNLIPIKDSNDKDRSTIYYSDDDLQTVHTRFIKRLSETIDKAATTEDKNGDLRNDVSIILSMLYEHFL